MPSLFKGKEFSVEQHEVITRGIEAGLTHKQLAVYAKPAFSPEQMEEILHGFLEGLSMSQINVLADPRVNVEDMRRIRNVYRLAGEINSGTNHLSDIIKKAETRSKAFRKSSASDKPLSK